MNRNFTYVESIDKYGESFFNYMAIGPFDLRFWQPSVMKGHHSKPPPLTQLHCMFDINWLMDTNLLPVEWDQMVER